MGKGGRATGAKGEPLPGRQRGVGAQVCPEEQRGNKLQLKNKLLKSYGEGEEPGRAAVGNTTLLPAPTSARSAPGEGGGVSVCLSVCLPSLRSPRPCLARPEAGAGSATSPGASHLPPSPGQARDLGKPPRGSPPATRVSSLGASAPPPQPASSKSRSAPSGKEEGDTPPLPTQPQNRGARGCAGSLRVGRGPVATALSQSGSSRGAGGISRQLRHCGSHRPSFVRAQPSSPCPDLAPAEIRRGGTWPLKIWVPGQRGGLAPAAAG